MARKFHMEFFTVSIEVPRMCLSKTRFFLLCMWSQIPCQSDHGLILPDGKSLLSVHQLLANAEVHLVYNGFHAGSRYAFLFTRYAGTRLAVQSFSYRHIRRDTRNMYRSGHCRLMGPYRSQRPAFVDQWCASHDKR